MGPWSGREIGADCEEGCADEDGGCAMIAAGSKAAINKQNILIIFTLQSSIGFPIFNGFNINFRPRIRHILLKIYLSGRRTENET